MGRWGVKTVLMVAAPLVLFAPPLGAQSPFTANTLRLDESTARPEATLDDVRWMAGSWRGAGFGGTVEEVWTAPSGGSMAGLFKLVVQGRAALYEMEWVVEEEGSLAIKLKHFGADLHGWEQPDELVEFPLVKLEERTAYFDGITYKIRNDGCLVVWAALEDDGEIAESELVFARVDDEGHPAGDCSGDVPGG